MATKKFVCKVCGYVHEGNAAPDVCPVCKMPSTSFEEVVEPTKKSWIHDTNNNAYIIFYSVVMVVIVAALLSFASLSLQERQYANELNEKKQAILSSLHATGENYDTYVNARVIDAEGNEIAGEDVFALLNDLPGSFAAGKFPVFEAKDGRIVLPITGSGLWGPIWGYLALEQDMNTVAGIVIAHKGETPGLGAEIATPKFQQTFVGKQLFEGDEFVSIIVRKGGAQDPLHEVDAISGGTKTSDGVTYMIEGSVRNYLPLMEARRTATEMQPIESNEVNAESHE